MKARLILNHEEDNTAADEAMWMAYSSINFISRLPVGALDQCKVSLHHKEFNFVWDTNDWYIEIGPVCELHINGIALSKPDRKRKHAWNEVDPTVELPEDMLSVIKMACGFALQEDNGEIEEVK